MHLQGKAVTMAVRDGRHILYIWQFGDMLHSEVLKNKFTLQSARTILVLQILIMDL